MGENAVTWITVCDTCRRDRDAPLIAGETDGARLAGLVEAAATATERVAVRRHACLMGCSGGCTVAIQARGKIAYTLGDFAPDAAAAEAVVAYACAHAQSGSGQVPYRAWPEGVKGHFVSRHPPLPD